MCGKIIHCYTDVIPNYGRIRTYVSGGGGRGCAEETVRGNGVQLLCLYGNHLDVRMYSV